MSVIYADYAQLIARFLRRKLPVEDFQASFFCKFQEESKELGEAHYALLDELFGDLDSYSHDAELIAEDPDFYLEEQQLRVKAADVLRRLDLLPAAGQAVVRLAK